MARILKSRPKTKGPARYALGRLKTGELNKTEAAYEAQLKLRLHAGEIVWYRFEGLRFQLAAATAYTPDFAVMLADGALECHEVKGKWEDDARVKIKVAAEMYPVRFVAVKKTKEGWEYETF